MSSKKIIAGVDEVGRGCLAGPVFAAALILTKEVDFKIKDSKALSAAQRLKMLEYIKEMSVFSLGIASVKEIEELNILNATKLAMQRAVINLAIAPEMLFIDGNQKIEIENIEQITIVQGDKKENCIAAASIIAKIARDQLMQDLHKEFPHYGWDNNKGYGTKKHIEGIFTHGVNIHHRRKFEPINSLCLKEINSC